MRIEILAQLIFAKKGRHDKSRVFLFDFRGADGITSADFTDGDCSKLMAYSAPMKAVKRLKGSTADPEGQSLMLQW